MGRLYVLVIALLRPSLPALHLDFLPILSGRMGCLPSAFLTWCRLLKVGFGHCVRIQGLSASTRL